MEASDVLAVKMLLRISEISAWVGAGPADLEIMVGGIGAVVGDTGWGMLERLSPDYFLFVVCRNTDTEV